MKNYTKQYYPQDKLVIKEFKKNNLSDEKLKSLINSIANDIMIQVLADNNGDMLVGEQVRDDITNRWVYRTNKDKLFPYNCEIQELNLKDWNNVPLFFHKEFGSNVFYITNDYLMVHERRLWAENFLVSEFAHERRVGQAVKLGDRILVPEHAILKIVE